MEQSIVVNHGTNSKGDQGMIVAWKNDQSMCGPDNPHVRGSNLLSS
jgi:hypothetical protein